MLLYIIIIILYYYYIYFLLTFRSLNLSILSNTSSSYGSGKPYLFFLGFSTGTYISESELLSFISFYANPLTSSQYGLVPFNSIPSYSPQSSALSYYLNLIPKPSFSNKSSIFGFLSFSTS